jgi:hypothetical protein
MPSLAFLIDEATCFPDPQGLDGIGSQERRLLIMTTNYIDRLDSALTEADVLSHVQKSFVELYTTSKNGLNVTKTGMGQRDRTDQESFRTELIRASNSVHHRLATDMYWCPITCPWYGKYNVKVAHIFAYHHGCRNIG